MSVELSKQTKEKFRKLSDSELVKTLSETSGRLESGQYSESEIEDAKKRAEQAGRNPNLYADDRAKTDLLITDYINQQASLQNLEERKKKG